MVTLTQAGMEELRVCPGACADWRAERRTQALVGAVGLEFRARRPDPRLHGHIKGLLHVFLDMDFVHEMS